MEVAQRFQRRAQKDRCGNCVRPPDVVRSLTAILGCGPSRVYYAGIPAANGSMRGIESEPHAPEGFRFSKHWSHRLAKQRCGDLPFVMMVPKPSLCSTKRGWQDG
jgi:hypothetical protein